MTGKLGSLLLLAAFAGAQPEVLQDRRVTFRVVAREVNPEGEKAWEINQDDLPGIPLYTVQEVSRLANGNTLINNWVRDVPAPEWPKIVQLIEVTPDKKVVWGLRDWSALGPASSTQLLDEPGAAEKGELQR